MPSGRGLVTGPKGEVTARGLVYGLVKATIGEPFYFDTKGWVEEIAADGKIKKINERDRVPSIWKVAELTDRWRSAHSFTVARGMNRGKPSSVTPWHIAIEGLTAGKHYATFEPVDSYHKAPTGLGIVFKWRSPQEIKADEQSTPRTSDISRTHAQRA